MKAQEIYKRLLKADKKTYHLILAELFQMVFGRKVKTSEWGFLRKLINLYGAEPVYWALLKSSAIDSSGNPLLYVRGVCVNTLQQQVMDATIASFSDLTTETRKLLEVTRSYQSPNWRAILNVGNQASAS